MRWAVFSPETNSKSILRTSKINFFVKKNIQKIFNLLLLNNWKKIYLMWGFGSEGKIFKKNKGWTFYKKGKQENSSRRKRLFQCFLASFEVQKVFFWEKIKPVIALIIHPYIKRWINLTEEFWGPNNPLSPR